MNDETNRYGFTWPGKHEAILEAGRPTDKVLRPITEDSVNFATTENIYIEGDNLDALKILLKGYMRRVKMIYIDPPYNTGHDFVYRDDFAVAEEESRLQLGFEDDGGRNYSLDAYRELRRSSPKFHSEWCSMIYPRLRVAQMLLRDDGVMFVSIDDGEQAKLRMMCDEIFGENNFVACLVWKGRSGRQDSKHFASIHEYILCYAKNITIFQVGEQTKEGDKYPKYDEERKTHYKTQLLRKWGSNSKREDRPNLYYPITAPDGSELYPMCSETQEGRWRWGKNTMQEAIASGHVEFVRDKKGAWVAYEKIYEGEIPTKKYDTWIDDIQNGTESLKELFDYAPFDYSKSPELVERLMRMANLDPDSIILDFFAGSSTTAHAVMSLNAQDSGHRKFIMIQLPEPCSPKSEAAKAGYATIAEIGRERIVRSGKWLVDSMKDKDKEAHNDSEKLPGFDGVAEGHESRQIDIFPREETPEGRTVLTLRPDETSSSINPIEHSRGASEKLNEGFSTLPINSERLKDGIGDTAAFVRGDRLPQGTGNLRSMGDSSGSRENASHTVENSPRPPLTITPLPTTSLHTTHYSLDIGFRAFKVASSNFRDVFRFPDDLTQETLADMADNIKPGRTDLDLLFMCVTDYGLPLSLPYRAESFGEFTVHIYSDGEIVACFGENLTEDAVKHIALMKPKRTVFRDSCFGSVSSRINMEQIFRAYSSGSEMTIL